MRPRFRLRPAFVLLLAAGLLAGGPRMGHADGFLALEDVRPGQRAVGKTVFTGRAIEEFELEIVGVVPGGRTEGAMILARALGERMEHDGIAAGMSGSPIYVDGKLIGALAFGWPFSRDALCGIQPIGDMLEVLRRPDGRPGGGFSDGPATPSDPEPLDPAAPGMGSPRVAAPPASGGGLQRLRIPLVAGGFGRAALAELEPWASAAGFQLVAGGAGGATSSIPRLGAAAARAALVPGAAMSVDLMRGDMNLAAIGTLTYREGDRVVAFGHPFFQTGDVAYPLALADVTTIVASDLSSFKMGTPAEQVGAITQDRRAAVAGVIGPVPAMLPLVVRVRAPGGPSAGEDFRFEIVRHRGFAPQLAAIAALGALSSSAGVAPEATWRWRLSLALPGRAPLTIEDTASGPLAAATAQLTAPLGLLLNNPFAPFDADSITLDLEVQTGASRAQVWSARIEPTVARPGDIVRVIASLQDLRGERREVDLLVTVPEGQPDGRLVVAVGGGADLDRQESARLPGRHRAVSLATLLERLADRRRADHVYAALFGPGLEPTVDGVAYPDLPSFAQRMLSADGATRPTQPWGRLAAVAESGRDVRAPVAGMLTVPLEVRRRLLGPSASRSGDRAGPGGLRIESTEEDP